MTTTPRTTDCHRCARTHDPDAMTVLGASPVIDGSVDGNYQFVALLCPGCLTDITTEGNPTGVGRGATFKPQGPCEYVPTSRSTGDETYPRWAVCRTCRWRGHDRTRWRDAEADFARHQKSCHEAPIRPEETT